MRGNSTAGRGGGIFNRAGTVRLKDRSSVKRNTAGLRGGGIYNDQGDVTLTDSSFVKRNIPDNCVHC